MKTIYALITFAMFFLSVQGVLAQQAYHGGSGDGYASATAKNVTLGVNGEIVKSGFDFTIYPNPARENQAVNLQIEIGNYALSLYGIDGKLISTFPLSEKRVQLPLLPAGTYLLKLENEELVSVRKLIVLP